MHLFSESYSLGGKALEFDGHVHISVFNHRDKAAAKEPAHTGGRNRCRAIRITSDSRMYYPRYPKIISQRAAGASAATA